MDDQATATINIPNLVDFELCVFLRQRTYRQPRSSQYFAPPLRGQVKQGNCGHQTLPRRCAPFEHTLHSSLYQTCAAIWQVTLYHTKLWVCCQIISVVKTAWHNANMTSFIRHPQNRKYIMRCNAATAMATGTENLVRFGQLVSEIFSRRDIQTDAYQNSSCHQSLTNNKQDNKYAKLSVQFLHCSVNKTSFLRGKRTTSRFNTQNSNKKWHILSNICRYTGPIFAIFSPYESSVCIDDGSVPYVPQKAHMGGSAGSRGMRHCTAYCIIDGCVAIPAFCALFYTRTFKSSCRVPGDFAVFCRCSRRQWRTAD